MAKVNDLYGVAQQILAERKAAQAKEEAEEIVKRENFRKELQEYFETDFADYLEMLKNAGISYQVQFNSENYWMSEGSFILFSRGDTKLKMDYYNQQAYRYEHAYKTDAYSKTFGNWNKEDFVIWIAENFPPIFTTASKEVNETTTYLVESGEDFWTILKDDEVYAFGIFEDSRTVIQGERENYFIYGLVEDHLN